MKKNIFKIIIVVLAIILAKDLFMTFYVNYKNKESITSYYNNDSSFNYENDMIISIPKINLERVVEKADSDFKNLNKSLVYYKRNDPSKKLIIFGHSGMGYGTYFNRLDELEAGNKAYLYINKYKVTYVVSKKYTVLETDISILNNDEKRSLFLVTCDKNNKKKRLIVKLMVENVKTLKK